MGEKILGIDLGTTNSCIAILEGGSPVVIPNSEGGRTTPSVVHFDKNGGYQVGVAAKRQAVQSPERTIQSVKRYMGTNHRIRIDSNSYSPEQISAFILEKLKLQAEKYLGEKIEKAIVTVPAYFDDAQRLATRQAGKLAGLNVVRMINEPTASALAYGYTRVGQEANIVVFDFGGGTFDVTILTMSEGVLQVRATNGNNRLGGDDFDVWTADALCDMVTKRFGVDFSADPVVMQRLREAAENCKIELSGLPSSMVRLPFLGQAKGEPIHFEHELSRQQFESITGDLVRATGKPIGNALRDAKLAAEDVSHVLLVGGTTRIPAVQQFIRTFFNREPSKSVNPDEAVAIGAAIQGAILAGEVDEVLLLDVLPLTLGIEEPDGSFRPVIERNTTIPVERSTTLTGRGTQYPLSVHILQGENGRATENTSLARFEVQDIPVGQTVHLTFKIDADGIFNCKCRVADREAQSVILKRTCGYNPNEHLRETQSEQPEHAEDQSLSDRLARMVLAEQSIANAEDFLAKYEKSLPPQTIKAMQASIENLRRLAQFSDTPELEHLRKKLDLQVKALSRMQMGQT